MWTVTKMIIVPWNARGRFGKETKKCPQKKGSDWKKKKKKKPNEGDLMDF